jgi:hypothetical protein
VLFYSSPRCALAIRQHDQAVDQAGEGGVNRVDLAQFRFE